MPMSDVFTKGNTSNTFYGLNLGCLHPVARVISYDIGFLIRIFFSLMMVVRPKHVAIYV
jgi:hypothetical protein